MARKVSREVMNLRPRAWFFRLFHASSSGLSSGEYSGRSCNSSIPSCSSTKRFTDLARWTE